MVIDRIVRFDVQLGLVCKTLISTTLCALLIMIAPVAVFAGTIKNYDKRNYRIEVTLKNHVKNIHPISSGATRGGICNSGCTLKILDVGNTIVMDPGDTISIKNGQFSVE